MVRSKRLLTISSERHFAVAANPLPDIALLAQLLRYEPTTGGLFWKPRPLKLFSSSRACSSWNARYAGQEAFACVNAHGYKVGSIYNRKYYGHRVVFALAHGRWPVAEIDHIDGDRANNHPDNLREVTPSENSRNTATRGDNTSGASGVYQHQNGRWRAVIAGKHLGYFPSLSEAHTAKKAAENALGYHPNHGRAA